MRHCSLRSLGALLMFASVVPALASARSDTAADSTLVLEGKKDGTSLPSMTVEAESKVRIQFERPSLHVDLDPASAPGLEWGSALDVLDRTTPDLLAPFLSQSAGEVSPYRARPWLRSLRSGPLVRFRPNLEEVARWRLVVADSRGETVRTFEGKGEPPEEIAWNGLTDTGEPAPTGLVYSYVLEAFDRAGNRRNFVGEGFELPGYRAGTVQDPTLLFSGGDLRPSAGNRSGIGVRPPLLLEVASHLNQAGEQERPVVVTVIARSYDQASALAEGIAEDLRALVPGGTDRVVTRTDVAADAPEQGSVRVALGP